MAKQNKAKGIEKIGTGLTKFQTPHTYAIIFFVVILCWILTFLVPAGKFNTETVEYQDSNGDIKSKTVLMADTFRYSYALDNAKLDAQLDTLMVNTDKLTELEIDVPAFTEFIATDSATWDQGQLDDLGLTDAVIYDLYGNSVFDTSKKLHKVANVWGTDDYDGFGWMNYLFEGLVTGNKYGSAVGIVALILVVGGSFGIIMRTGAIDAGIFAFISKPKVLERLAEARAMGDLSENSEYTAAREELALMDGRIEELQEIVKGAEIIKEDHSAKGKKAVQLGSKVKVEVKGKHDMFSLVGEWEADPKEKKISHESPLGKALIGKAVGENVEVEAPAGKIVYTVVEID